MIKRFYSHFSPVSLVCLFSILFLKGLSAQNFYYPKKNATWKQVAPETFQINSALLAEAVAFAQANEYSGDTDLRIAIAKGFAREPYHKLLGPTKRRGGPAGMILKNGQLIAQWGDTKRVDMTFSVTKSYLSTVAGLAIDQNLIVDVNDGVKDYVWDTTFDGTHNSQINWEHLLNQSSDWSGTLWGGHDWADRPPREGDIDHWKNRKLYPPGTHYKYNDVRVNVLAYALLQVWRKPLPQVLKTHIMDPIGASSTWRWFGYENSWVNVDGNWVQSVSGGGHSGGGLFINTEDHARFGLLFLSNGVWNGKRLLSKKWIEAATTPSAANVNYGYMWWLNQKEGSRYWEGVPENVYYAAGFGGNFIVVIPDEAMVVVTRWLEPRQIGPFIKKVLDATPQVY